MITTLITTFLSLASPMIQPDMVPLKRESFLPENFRAGSL